MSTGMQNEFTKAYEDFHWKNPESRSGPGSTMEYTKPLRALLPGVLRALGVKSMLDAPCGDFHWMKDMDLNGIDYIGGDIVAPMIANLTAQYPDRDFRVLDITNDLIPKVDFWHCRDVLIHLSISDIFKVLFNFLKSGSQYLATTHHANCGANVEVLSSPKSFHEVNLTLPPFGLGQPLITLHDTIPNFPPRSLGIWERKQVAYWFNINVMVAQQGSAFLNRTS